MEFSKTQQHIIPAYFAGKYTLRESMEKLGIATLKDFLELCESFEGSIHHEAESNNADENLETQANAFAAWYTGEQP